ncbi:LysR family transcriptional regulator [Actinacidiphila acididurans]|uniref:LysR family transcriptional regulator n=1 Tax=Actinacidiphila acididurans TaxID=2784346 RepID=UPI0027DCDF11|nr:LysR family transcriptional regulator [Actinacidiphila acididurans]
MPDANANPGGFDLGPDLDLRLVRYFVVVAEQASFGRAAAVLHLAQPSLSRQIQRLESRLGVRLLDRTPQGSRLTEAGEAFLPQARALLYAARRAMRTARDAAPPRAITVGYVEDFVVTPAVRDLRRRHPDAQVRTRHLTSRNARDALLGHQVDAVVARAPFPFPTDRLRVTVLYEEPRVLVVPDTHRLAGKESVGPNDFADESFIPCPAAAAAMDWGSFWHLDPRSDGLTAPTGPVLIDSFEDKLELVADGQAVAVLPAGDRRTTLRPDLATIPIDGIEPCQVVVATRADDHDPLVADFHESAKEHLARTA